MSRTGKDGRKSIFGILAWGCLRPQCSRNVYRIVANNIQKIDPPIFPKRTVQIANMFVVANYSNALEINFLENIT